VRKNQKNLRASQCCSPPNIRTYRNISELSGTLEAEEEQMQQPEVEQAYFVDNREFKATSAKMLGSGAN